MPTSLKVYIFVLPFSELYINEVIYCISFFSLNILRSLYILLSVAVVHLYCYIVF